MWPGRSKFNVLQGKPPPRRYEVGLQDVEVNLQAKAYGEHTTTKHHLHHPVPDTIGRVVGHCHLP